MQKSFKKVIACMLAVLMIALSMPLSALAVPGDYAPDVQLQFSTFCDDPCDPTNKNSADSTAYTASGLAGFPLIWDQENGTLTAKKEDINTYNTYWETDPVDADWQLGEGDMFVATIRFDNVSEAASGNVNIRFSDNLTPAGVWQSGTGKNVTYVYANENEAPTKPTALNGFRAPIADWSASTLYNGMNDTDLGDKSCIQADPTAQPDDGWSDLMMTATLICSGDSVDVSSVSDELGFFDITNGTYSAESGYTYGNKFIVVSFAFQITGSGPIQFALQDPTGNDLASTAFFAKKHEDPSDPDKLTLDLEYATTYAPNGNYPGSMKMTFMGENDNVVTVTFKNADGSVISSTNYAKGTAIAIPDLPETVVGETTHTTYAWDTEVSATADENATYQVVATESNHAFENPVVTKNPTCTEKGVMTYTCECGKTSTEEIAMIDHVKGEPAEENRIEPTCTADGSYDSVIYCTVCENVVSSETVTIPALGHDYQPVVTEATCTEGGYTTYTCSRCKDSYTDDKTEALGHDYQAVVTAPTCTEQGYTTYTCSRCKDSYKDSFVDPTGHTPAEKAVKENEVAATCEKAGSYDEVIYCTVCNAELSREPKTVAALGHKWDAGKVTKKATPTATGVKTYTCTVCKKTKTETIPKCAKYTNPMKVSGKTATVKYSAVKKKNQTVKQSKAFSVSKAQGKVTYKKSSGNSKITVSSAGKITVKKGLKKGTYKVKVKVTAAGNSSYKKLTKTVTVTIKVK